MRVKSRLSDANHEEGQVSRCVVGEILGSTKINGHPKRDMMRKDAVQHLLGQYQGEEER